MVTTLLYIVHKIGKVLIDHGTGRSTCILMNNSRLELLNALYVDVLFRMITDSSRAALPVFSKVETGEAF